MNEGKLVLAQIMEHLPLTTFRRCVARYNGAHKASTFSCLEAESVHSVRATHMARELAQHRSLSASPKYELHHLDMRGNVDPYHLATQRAIGASTATSSNVWIRIARRLCAEELLGTELKDTTYTLASITIDLCRSVVFLGPLSIDQPNKAAVKPHTRLDLRGNILLFISSATASSSTPTSSTITRPDTF